MTSTLTSCTRETIGAYAVTGKGPDHVRPVIIRIDRDCITFRVKGKRELFRLPVEQAFRHAVVYDTMAAPPVKPPPLEHVKDEKDEHGRVKRRHWKTRAADAGQTEFSFETPPEYTETQINRAAEFALATA